MLLRLLLLRLLLLLHPRRRGRLLLGRSSRTGNHHSASSQSCLAHRLRHRDCGTKRNKILCFTTHIYVMEQTNYFHEKAQVCCRGRRRASWGTPLKDLCIPLSFQHPSNLTYLLPHSSHQECSPTFGMFNWSQLLKKRVVGESEIVSGELLLLVESASLSNVTFDKLTNGHQRQISGTTAKGMKSSKMSGDSASKSHQCQLSHDFKIFSRSLDKQHSKEFGRRQRRA